MTRSKKQLLAARLVVIVCLVLLGCGTVIGEEREEWQPPQKIMDAVGVRPGMIIGEAGAGEGYLTFHLAARVGSAGKIYANEISASDLKVIRERAAEQDIRNIQTVRGEIADPRFPVQDLDMIIMVYVLHHLDQPLPFLQSLRQYLKPGAPLVIIERNTHEARDDYDHRSFMAGHQVLDVVKAADFELIRTETFLPKDTIYIYHVAGSPH